MPADGASLPTTAASAPLWSVGRQRPRGACPAREPAPPAYIRKQAIANAISFCGVERLMFGSDSVIPSDLKHQGELVKRDGALFDDLGLSAAQKERLFSGTAEELFPARG